MLVACNLLHTTYYLLPTNYYPLPKARGECELTCTPAVGATGYQAIQAIPTATWLGVGLGLGLGYRAIQAGHALSYTWYSTKMYLLRCICQGILTMAIQAGDEGALLLAVAPPHVT